MNPERLPASDVEKPRGTTSLGSRAARRLRRYEVKLPLRFECAMRCVIAEAIDLAADGMRIRTSAAHTVPLRTLLDVTIHVGEARLTLRSRVTRHAEDELAVEFCDAPDVVRRSFRSVICSLYPRSVQAARLYAEEATRRAEQTTPARPQKVSLVVPMYNEEHGAAKFHAELMHVLEAIDGTLEWEINYIDDGSSDRTLGVLSEIADAAPEVRVYSLSRNFGHQAALMAGLEASTGMAVVTMDGDLQHPPSVLPLLIEKWQDGFDVVQARRTSTPKLGLFKRVSSRSFYRIFEFLSALRLPTGAADFRLLDRHVVDAITSLQERNVFLRGITQWMGFPTAYIEYDAAERTNGVTQFSLKKMLALAADGIFAFSVFPLRIALYLGILSLALTCSVVLYVAQAKLRHVSVPGWASLLIISSLFSGLQLLVLGVVAEYMGRVFSEVKRRPRFLLKEIVGVDDPVFVCLREVVSEHGL